MIPWTQEEKSALAEIGGKLSKEVYTREKCGHSHNWNHILWMLSRLEAYWPIIVKENNTNGVNPFELALWILFHDLDRSKDFDLPPGLEGDIRMAQQLNTSMESLMVRTMCEAGVSEEMARHVAECVETSHGKDSLDEDPLVTMGRDFDKLRNAGYYALVGIGEGRISFGRFTNMSGPEDFTRVPPLRKGISRNGSEVSLIEEMRDALEWFTHGNPFCIKNPTLLRLMQPRAKVLRAALKEFEEDYEMFGVI